MAGSSRTRCLLLALVLGMAVVFLAPTAVAQAPDPDRCVAVATTSESVSVLVRPDGGGWPFSAAMAFGGARTDATITVTLHDGAGAPVASYPAEDLWLTASDLGGPYPFAPCGSGMIADGATNAAGQTTFADPLRAGGAGAGATVMIGTWPTPEAPIAFAQGDLFRFNSPDISGDLSVNLVDVSLFASDFYAAYNYRSDFFWDGTLNLSDLAVMAQSLGASCP